MNDNPWLKKVNQINSTRYQIPAGWKNKDEVAELLACAPDKVGEILKPGIADGSFERQTFPVWDAGRRCAIQVVCYRLGSSAPVAEAKPAQVKKGKAAPAPANRDGRIRQAIKANPGLSDAAVARNLYKVTADEVRKVRGKLG